MAVAENYMENKVLDSFPCLLPDCFDILNKCFFSLAFMLFQ